MASQVLPYILVLVRRNGKPRERSRTYVYISLIPLVSIKRYTDFKNFQHRICVSTDVFGRGIDIERINVAVNYDMPDTPTQQGATEVDTLPQAADTYLHRVGRAGRFGTKGVAVSFVSTERDEQVLKAIEARFEKKIDEYPEGGQGVNVKGD